MNLRILIAVSIIFVSFIALFFVTTDSENSTMIQVLDTSDFLNKKEKYATHKQEVRLRGFVKEGSILLYGNKADFVVYQDKKFLAVHYNGTEQIPDTFRDGSPVRLDGYYSLEQEKFIVHKIEAKCASKYDVPQSTASMPVPTSIY